MTEVDDRLVRCFSSIFPASTDEEIRAIDLERFGDMDSLAGVTLVAVIEQEFGVALELEELLALRSFDAVQRYVNEQHRY
ncbi:MAG TPA: acyl carrier protein [Chthoniobacterales bacterium]|nr:acyl carrier protein [Chthoniobacterales bacterium]